MRGARLLDAGCGTGALSIEAAKRGALVTAIDVAPTLIQLAQERTPADLNNGRIDFRAGDMLDPALGTFDFVVAMDSLIHYRASDCVDAVASLSVRTGGSILFTFAPRTPALAAMHAVGRLFPRKERAPAIEPVRQDDLLRRLGSEPALHGWSVMQTERIVNGFYTSQAVEIRNQ
jgi:magnesium-protoporphyrin O-methyltransferase